MSNETYDPNPSGENQTGDMADPEEYAGLVESERKSWES